MNTRTRVHGSVTENGSNPLCVCVCVYVLVCVYICTTGIPGSDEGSLSRPSHSRGARGEEPIASWKSQSRAAREAFGTHERKMQSCVDVLPPHTGMIANIVVVHSSNFHEPSYSTIRLTDTDTET
jgi:hypothetical protein